MISAGASFIAINMFEIISFFFFFLFQSAQMWIQSSEMCWGRSLQIDQMTQSHSLQTSLFISFILSFIILSCWCFYEL